MSAIETTFPSRLRRSASKQAIRTAREVRTIRIALLGCGTVGREVARLLTEERPRLERAAGVRFELSPILVRDPSRDRGISRATFTRSFKEILDSRPDLVIEALGGVQPAAEFIAEALERGIPVVSANKTLLAHEGPTLRSIAVEHDVPLRHEASVGGATPILATLRQIGADRVRSITGVVNGSCNAILEWMLFRALSRDEAIAEAQHRGLVEPDPTADISGRDSAEKLVVLAQALGHDLAPRDVSCEGIERIERADLAFAQRKRLAIRLVAQLERTDDGLIAQVAPRLVAKDSALGRLDGPRNAFVIEMDLAGRIALEGVGAGPSPTASAILGDVVAILRGDDAPPAPPLDEPTQVVALSDAIAPCFVRLPRTGAIDPDAISRSFAARDIALSEVAFEGEVIRMLTRPARVSAVRLAASELAGETALIVIGHGLEGN